MTVIWSSGERYLCCRGCISPFDRETLYILEVVGGWWLVLKAQDDAYLGSKAI